MIARINNFFIYTSLMVGLFVAVPLSADDAPSKWRFGIEASVGTPVGDAGKIASTGLGLCMFAEHEIEGFGLEAVDTRLKK